MLDRVTHQNKPKIVQLQFQNNQQKRNKCWLFLTNKIYSSWSCFANLLDESWAGEIWELPASSSHSWNDCRFVGVKGSPISGSWSVVIEMDCWIEQTITISWCKSWTWWKSQSEFLIPFDHLYACGLESWSKYYIGNRRQYWKLTDSLWIGSLESNGVVTLIFEHVCIRCWLIPTILSIMNL